MAYDILSMVIQVNVIIKQFNKADTDGSYEDIIPHYIELL